MQLYYCLEAISIQICFSIVSGACFLIIKFSYLLVVPILCSVDDLHMMDNDACINLWLNN
jgi:hypothetical protein